MDRGQIGPDQRGRTGLPQRYLSLGICTVGSLRGLIQVHGHRLCSVILSRTAQACSLYNAYPWSAQFSEERHARTILTVPLFARLSMD